MPKSDTQFKKGQSGNLAGRPKGRKTWKLVFQEFLDMQDKLTLPDGETVDVPIQYKIAYQLVKMAKEGDLASIKELIDRCEGKPTQRIAGGDDDDNPIDINSKLEVILVDGQKDDK